MVEFEGGSEVSSSGCCQWRDGTAFGAVRDGTGQLLARSEAGRDSCLRGREGSRQLLARAACNTTRKFCTVPALRENGIIMES